MKEETLVLTLTLSVILCFFVALSSCHVLSEKERTERVKFCLQYTEQVDQCADLMGPPPGGQ